MKRKKKHKHEWKEDASYRFYSPKQKTKDRYLQRKYGITLAEYNNKRLLQNEACALCLRHESNFKNGLATDHNHKSGVVRGLLCYSCNKYKVGRNNLETVTKLMQYMQKYEGK